MARREFLYEFNAQNEWEWPETVRDILRYVVDLLTTHYRDPTVLPPIEVQLLILDLIKKAYALQGFAAIDVDGPTFIFGDLHGGYSYFFRQLSRVWYVHKKGGGYLRRDVRIVLLGDIVDRGPESLRMLYLIYALKLLFWNQVFIIRGNHELKRINRRYGFYAECLETYPKGEGQTIYDSHNEFFGYLPFIGRVNKKIVCMHGGILEDPKFDLAKFMELLTTHVSELSPEDQKKYEEFSWNDPDRREECANNLPQKEYGSSNIECNSNILFRPKFDKTENRGKLFNEAATDQFCGRMQVDLVQQKFGFDIHKKTSPCCTVFSAPMYDDCENTGAVMGVIPTEDGMGIADIFIIQFDPDANGDPDEEEEEEADDKTIDSEECVTKTATAPGRTVTVPGRTLGGTVKALGGTATVIGGAATVIGVFSLAATGGTFYVKRIRSSESTQQQRDSFAEKSNIISRLINGVSTSESMEPGPFDEKQLINELFPYGDNSEGLDVTDDIDAIINVMGSECTGDNGCKVNKEMMEKLDEKWDFDPKKLQLPTAIPVGSNIMDVPTSFDKLKKDNYANIFLEMITLTRAAEDSTMWGHKMGAAGIPLKNSDAYISELTKFSSMINVADHLDGRVNTLKTISSVVPLQQFKIDLDAAQAKYHKLMSVATPDFIKNLKSKLEKLAEMDPKSNENKLITAGFYNGFEDMKNVLKDDENAWLKEALNLGKDLNELKLKLKPLKGLVEKLEPLNKVWKEVNFDSAQKSIYDMQLFVNNLDVFSKASNTLSSVQTCLKDVNTGLKFNIDFPESVEILQSISAQLPLLKSSVDEFATDDIKQALKTIFGFFEPNQYNRTQFKAELEKVPGIDHLVGKLTKLQTALEGVDAEKLRKAYSLVNEFDSKIMNPFKTWLGNLDFLAISTCLKGQNTKADFEKLYPKLEALMSTKPSQDQVDPVNKLTGGLKKLGMEMAKIKVSVPKKGRHRRRHANKEIVLESHQIKAKELGKVNTIIQKMIKVKAMENDVKTLIDGKAQIDAVIQKESDPKVKDKLNKLWNDNIVETLKGIQAVANGLAQEIKKKEIKMIKDFTPTYQVAANTTDSKVDIKKLASMLDGKIQNSNLAASLKNLKSLDLKFTKHNSATIKSYIEKVQEYFDLVFDVERGCDGESCEANEEDPNFWYYISAGVGGILLIGGVSTFFIVRHLKNKKKKMKSYDPSSVSDSSAMKPSKNGTKESKKNEKSEEAPKQDPKEPPKKDSKGPQKTVSKESKNPTKKSKKSTKKKTKKAVKKGFKPSYPEKTPVQLLKESGYEVYEIGLGLQVLVKDGKVFVETIASRNGECSQINDFLRKNLKEARRLQKETPNLLELNRANQTTNRKAQTEITIPAKLKNKEELIKKLVRGLLEKENYNRFINIPQRIERPITVVPWTKAILTRVGQDVPPVFEPRKDGFNMANWRNGTYIPYVTCCYIGEKHEIVAEVDPATMPTQSSVADSVRTMRTSDSASNLITAMEEKDPTVQLVDKAYAAMKKALGH
ncbi:hypothetical protein CAEBREN_29002 [Caenorhabditis brenneri]|uniref:Serine/threonine-protein phosphatase n=1 Tax=Caenorhabditis brenneri TaxID=135651 RepID=G0NHC5_CAEBE|nr:hypothetical protein CAEBREN_29002 [Caenorhabditis brenneri]